MVEGRDGATALLFRIPQDHRFPPAGLPGIALPKLARQTINVPTYASTELLFHLGSTIDLY